MAAFAAGALESFQTAFHQFLRFGIPASPVGDTETVARFVIRTLPCERRSTFSQFCNQWRKVAGRLGQRPTKHFRVAWRLTVVD
jgi:hypothetical protein